MTIEDLLAYELAIETAWAAVLNAASTPQLVLNANVMFSDGDRTFPRTDVQLQTNKVAQWKTVEGVKYPISWEGTLVSRVETVRGKNSARQAVMLGRIRATALQFRSKFTRDLLPYHAVSDLRLADVPRGIDPQQNLDASELRLPIFWNIRTDVPWPAA